MALHTIRIVGDPVLKQRSAEVTDIDGKLAALATDMIETMYAAPGAGLAANQVGIQKRLFVYDAGAGDGPQVLVNPVISESRGEWEYEEGCLSVPGLYFPIVRPKEVHLTGYDLDSREVSIEADEFLARIFQHEMDHLDGTLLLARLDKEQRRDAMRALRDRGINGQSPPPGPTPRL